MKRTKKKRAHTATAPAPRGYVVHTAHCDGSAWFSIEMYRQIGDEDVYHDPDDPILSIIIDRRKAERAGDPPQTSTNQIENIRASDIDQLIAQLTDVLTAARVTGMLPPRISDEDYIAHLDARRAAIKARTNAGGQS